MSTLAIEYLDLKLAEYFDAQYLVGGLQLILIFKRIWDIATIIKESISDEVQPFEEASSDEMVSDDFDFDRIVRSQLLDAKTSKSPGVLTLVRSMSLRAIGKAAKSFENLFSEAEEDSDVDLFDLHPLASLMDDSSVKHTDRPRLQSAVSAPLSLMRSVSVHAVRRAQENLQLVAEDSAFTPGLISIVRSVTRRA